MGMEVHGLKFGPMFPKRIRSLIQPQSSIMRGSG